MNPGRDPLEVFDHLATAVFVVLFFGGAAYGLAWLLFFAR